VYLHTHLCSNEVFSKYSGSAVFALGLAVSKNSSFLATQMKELLV